MAPAPACNERGKASDLDILEPGSFAASSKPPRASRTGDLRGRLARLIQLPPKPTPEAARLTRCAAITKGPALLTGLIRLERMEARGSGTIIGHQLGPLASAGGRANYVYGSA